MKTNAQERLIRITVEPDARVDKLNSDGRGGFDVCVRVPSSENRANDRARELVAAKLGISVKAVRLVSGHHRPRKTLRIMER